MTTFATALAAGSDGGFSWGTLLMFIGGALLLIFFCGIGFIARIREHKLEAKRELRRTAAPTTPTDGPPTP